MDSREEKRPPENFNQNLEQLRFWERTLFGEEFIRIAIQAGHRDSARFYTEMSIALESCSTLEEATRLGQSIKRMVPRFCERAKGCPAWLIRQLQLARSAEMTMIAEIKQRESKGMPNYFDRRVEKWVRREHWHPVPFVDDALLNAEQRQAILSDVWR